VHTFVAFGPTGTVYDLGADKGELIAQYGDLSTHIKAAPKARVEFRTRHPPALRIVYPTFWRRRGFYYYRSDAFPGWTLIVPHWFGLLPMIPSPLAHAGRMIRRRRRLRRGLCPRCGYDLTANPSGVCPECGGPAPPPAADPSAT
jgi:hypothetical protein